MKRIIGLKKEAQEKEGKGAPPDFGEVIASTDSRADSVTAKVERIDNELKKYKEQLGKMREGPAKRLVKEKAMRLLQQKKVYEKQAENLRQQAFNMEQATFATQTIQDAKTAMSVMKSGVKSMQKELKKVRLEDIDELQDDMAEMTEIAEEIQGALGRTYDMPILDDEDLEAELELLGDDIAADSDTSYLDEAMLPPPLPVTGTQRPEVVKKAEDVDEFGLPKIPNGAL